MIPPRVAMFHVNRPGTVLWAVPVIQGFARMIVTKLQYKRIQRALVRIQRYAVGFLPRIKSQCGDIDLTQRVGERERASKVEENTQRHRRLRKS